MNKEKCIFPKTRGTKNTAAVHNWMKRRVDVGRKGDEITLYQYKRLT
jgi:hypothetical protein